MKFVAIQAFRTVPTGPYSTPFVDIAASTALWAAVLSKDADEEWFAIKNGYFDFEIWQNFDFIFCKNHGQDELVDEMSN